MQPLAEAQLDLETISVEDDDVEGIHGEVGAQSADGTFSPQARLICRFASPAGVVGPKLLVASLAEDTAQAERPEDK